MQFRERFFAMASVKREPNLYHYYTFSKNLQDYLGIFQIAGEKAGGNFLS
jgi:hypothetical protein